MNLSYERNLYTNGYNLIAGIDEAGRGPLAGPVVAACAIFRPDFSQDDIEFSELRKVNDSKQLNTKTREEVYEEIIKKCLAYGIGVCDNKIIDRINILQAAFLAMKKAISAMKQKPNYLLVDGGFAIPNSSLKQEAVVDGDAKIFSIAAASIIAKVTRDRLMRDAHERFPNYGFDKNKGYGTKFHLACLKKYGPCEIHRQSFRPVKNSKNKI